MKKVLLIIALLISALGLNAQDATIDDLEFTVTSETPAECEVSGYSGKPVDITIPSTVTISGKEFAVTSIGDNAFSGCSSLTSIEIPSGVTYIGYSAFYYYCSSLTSIEFGENSQLTFIGDRAFSDCYSLTSIEFGENSQLTFIGAYAFSDCYSLTSIEIPSGVTYIGACAFSYCSSLTSIEIPSGVTSIGEGVFERCSSLTSIIVDNGNTVYDSRDNCNAIIETATNTLIAGCQNTVIPNNVTSIGEGAFSGCSSLTSIEIPSGVTSIGEEAFGRCSSLTSIDFGENSQLTSIGEEAFYDCSSLTSIDFGENSQLTSIGDRAFYYCSSLTSIEIPSGVTSIGENAFSGCSSLTSIIVENGNTVYDSRDNCNAIIETATNTLIAGCQNTVIPNNVTSIGEGAFSGCSSLTSIEIPSGVTSIGEGAFSGCSSLTSIEIPSGVTSIGEEAFGRCSSLTSIDFGENSQLTSIGEEAFYDCSSLTSIDFGENSQLTSIGDRAFYYCSSLTSIEIPSGVTSIGENAFSGCSSLTSIIVENGNTVYDSRDNCNAIIETATNTLIVGCQNTVIPNTVSFIGDYAFFCCSSLTSIEIPSGVTSIGKDAFGRCSSLTSIDFGENSQLTSIGYSFERCSSLTSIYCYAETVPETSQNAFFGCPSNMVIYVPAQSIDAYKAATPWNNYTIMPLTGDDDDDNEDPEQPGDEPEQPGDEPEQPGDEPEQPGDEPEQPGDEPEQPGDEPEQPGDEPEDSDVPAKPKNLVAEALNATTIILEWDDVKNAKSYNVYQDGDLIDNIKGVVYKANDLDADTEYCFTVAAVNEAGKSAKSKEACATTAPDAVAELTSSFRIYPNPANDKLYIEVETEIKEIVVYDIYGKTQKLKNSESQNLRISVDLSNLNAGIYFIRLVTNDGVITKQFVKN